MSLKHRSKLRVSSVPGAATAATAATAAAVCGLACWSATARAQTEPSAAPETAPEAAESPPPASGASASSPAPVPDSAVPEFTKKIGGHVGIALPLVTVASKTTTIGDQFTILNPIGIGFKVSDHVAIDFETIVSNPIHPVGTTGLVVDPGIIYGMGRVSLGLRVAFQINSEANVGLIPLVNVGLADLGGAMWFVEAAFPTFYSDQKASLTTVFHTGIGF